MKSDPCKPTLEEYSQMRALIAQSDSIPEWILEMFAKPFQNVAEITIEENVPKKDYLDFLAQQIELEARGPDWTLELRRRHDALEPYLDHLLAWWSVASAKKRASIRVTRDYQTIVYLEEDEVLGYRRLPDDPLTE